MTSPTPDILGDIFAATNTAGMLPENVPLKQIKPNPYQSRSQYDNIEELALDIERNGLLQPAVGRRVGLSVELAIGHRRYKAFEWLNANRPDTSKWRMMPVVVKPLADDTMAKVVWSENHQRDNISPVDEARHMQRMIDEFGFTQEEVAEELGLSREVVANRVRLLKLPAAAQELLQDGYITTKHGLQLLRLAPAPAWLDEFVADLIKRRQQGAESGSVADLESNISYRIDRAIPIPDKPIKVKRTSGYESEFSPTSWPMGWTSRSPDVVGPCQGCTHLVTFGRDSFPRCVQTNCHDAKKRIWNEQQREKQMEAARRAAAALPTVAPAQPAKASAAAAKPAGDVNAEESGGIPFSRSDQYNLRVFGTADAPAGLLEHGLCGKGKCECFKLKVLEAYRLNGAMLGPDRTEAPSVVYVCENHSRLHAQRNRLQEIVAPEDAQKRKDAIQAKSNATRQAKEQLRQAFEQMTPADLANNAAFMRRIASRYDLEQKGEAREIWERLFWRIAQNLCQVGEWDGPERTDRWDLNKVAAFLAGFDVDHQQPGPGDSQRTGWEHGWDHEDERTWSLIIAELIPTDPPDQIYRPRVLLRMIETTTVKDQRAALWRRYNQLIPQEATQ